MWDENKKYQVNVKWDSCFWRNITKNRMMVITWFEIADFCQRKTKRVKLIFNEKVRDEKVFIEIILSQREWWSWYKLNLLIPVNKKQKESSRYWMRKWYREESYFWGNIL